MTPISSDKCSFLQMFFLQMFFFYKCSFFTNVIFYKYSFCYKCSFFTDVLFYKYSFCYKCYFLQMFCITLLQESAGQLFPSTPPCFINTIPYFTKLRSSVVVVRAGDRPGSCLVSLMQFCSSQACLDVKRNLASLTLYYFVSRH